MKTTQITILILGIAIGIIVGNIFSLSVSPAQADSGASQGDMIAVTGACTNNLDGLWVIKTSEGDRSPSVCLYLPEGGASGRGFRLVGARLIKWDLKLSDWKPKGSEHIEPDKIKQEWEKMNEGKKKNK